MEETVILKGPAVFLRISVIAPDDMRTPGQQFPLLAEGELFARLVDDLELSAQQGLPTVSHAVSKGSSNRM